MNITGILFNHDPASSQVSALNIRRNFDTALSLPEWVPGRISHVHSPAAYAVDEIDHSRVSIRARFRAPEFAGRQVEIAAMRAVVPDLPEAWQDLLNQQFFFATLSYYYWRNVLNTLWTLAYELQDDVLGVVPPTPVYFDAAGESGWVPLSLKNHRLKSVGVGRQQITWRWVQRPLAGGAWQPITDTHHTIYTVLRTPTRPWLQTPFVAENTQLPWTDALDRACIWADNAVDLGDASQRITRAINNLGGRFFEYGCRVGAITVYSEPYFNFTKMLERVSGGLGLGRYVNCSDCATFVSTFANLLGADLWQGQMRDFARGFPVNPIRAIGDNVIVPPCGLGIFNYHEVAWDGRATEDDEVYDACLEVDTNVGSIHPNMVLPTRLRFGAPGDGQYRDLLAAPWGREVCTPQPQLKRRRFVI